jgi:hypothetical protein
MFFITISCAIYYFLIDSNTIPYPKINEKTALGNHYDFVANKSTRINGTPVYTYICGYELKEEWSKKSTKGIFEINPSGYENYYILIQYLASKGYLKKDAETFNKLTVHDIKNIESGINNCCPSQSRGLLNRLIKLREEFYEQDPNGKTIKQRFEYVKAGYSIFIKHPLLGVGSGDLDDAFKSHYKETNSTLKIENRLRTHNQFLTYFISLGLVGGILFIYLIYKSFIYFYQQQIQLGFYFLILISISFLSEDTLETQMGATLFGLFYGLFISSKKNELLIT